MNCKKCKKKMANCYPENVAIKRNRIGKEIGSACINSKCKDFRKVKE